MNKIIILTSVHNVFDTRIFHKQAKSLVRAGYSVTLVAQHDKNEIVDSIRIIGLPKQRNRLQRMTDIVFRAMIISIKEKANVYHFHDPELLIVALIIKFFTKAKIIYDIHENVKKQILNKIWIPGVLRGGLSILYSFIEKLFLRFIDYIIVAEDSYMKEYKNYNNVIPVRNYPLIEYIKQNKLRIPNYSSGLKYLIYIGGITRIRGALELVKAFSILHSKGYQNVFLKLIGPITQSFKLELQQIIEEHKIGTHVIITGNRVSLERVYEELFKSHIGIAIMHPDLNFIESIPTKFFEYMSAQLPIIASNFPLWKEIIEGNKCGLTVDPMNHQDIAESIIYLLERPELMKEMGKNGRKAVFEKYNWEKESEKLLEIYRLLLPLVNR